MSIAFLSYEIPLVSIIYIMVNKNQTKKTQVRVILTIQYLNYLFHLYKLIIHRKNLKLLMVSVNDSQMQIMICNFDTKEYQKFAKNALKGDMKY